ncbi:Fis family sigma54 specific transcriptional regulator [Paraburkholderia caballeronis]|uniref:DNA-binding transcriptional response regulator, NtrC family, contains REC, AAA-type ATPase, and a Fis-type DNA-binding domains n=1 Tax=Paraburkholderia caballeronis TaxID=416943 RepID=A0A1H7UMR2_9BURK|nr:Fis family sigma54 specific transcriptional regulator [Paraburkholderia caballeronis]PXX02146.1 Fis family sigma54 specific transcriptional regulator [Paraburkholderia caballeronis]RAK01303.1 Fis family sigma54 specific transcriptional regulator [Paraburkholderia caballeronis]TDV06264.1 Fis family sigma54 specific transcriptional regulator [Paraburkholderia caballeronis]TDV09766.1 Fis family sigma54 specific transcriptional regulator [Paraburkholderia caballeronis]
MREPSPLSANVTPFASVARRLAVTRPPQSAVAPQDHDDTLRAPQSEPATERPLLYVARAPDMALVAYLKSRGWDLVTARTPYEATKQLKPDLACAGVVDLTGFGQRELGSLETSLRLQQVGWIVLTDENRLADPGVRRLIRHYCFDYVQLPVAHATLDYLVNHALGMVALCDLDAPPAATATPDDDEMVGTCDAMQQLFRTIRKVANTDATVFISGESGTGKELTALAIHERSARRKAPFVPINCGAIPHHLLQSELFGYERGAFTGANQRKVGRVESADGGTLFLDEIGDLPLESQASLLRFLQEGKIERLGGHEQIQVDVRIISATHVDLETAMREGRFRQDLYHRLCVLRVDEPPLRARGKDIEILAHHILRKFKMDSARRIRGFTPCAIEAMYNYNWPGNVRELINRVRRAIVMAESKLISAEDLDLAQFAGSETLTLAQAREAAERRAIEAALLRHRHRLAEAAAELGISRVTLYRLMGSHGLRDEKTTFDADAEAHE